MHALAVRVIDGVADLARVVERLRQLERAVAADDVLERFARHVLHHDEEDVVLLLGRQDRDDVRVVEAGEQAGFAEQFAEVDALAVGDLERDLLADPGVFGEIDRPEPAAAEGREDLVLPDGLTAKEHTGLRWSIARLAYNCRMLPRLYVPALTPATGPSNCRRTRPDTSAASSASRPAQPSACSTAGAVKCEARVTAVGRTRGRGRGRGSRRRRGRVARPRDAGAGGAQGRQDRRRHPRCGDAGRGRRPAAPHRPDRCARGGLLPRRAPRALAAHRRLVGQTVRAGRRARRCSRRCRSRTASRRPLQGITLLLVEPSAAPAGAGSERAARGRLRRRRCWSAPKADGPTRKWPRACGRVCAVTLGRRTLRADAAALVALSVLQYAWGLGTGG